MALLRAFQSQQAMFTCAVCDLLGFEAIRCLRSILDGVSRFCSGSSPVANVVPQRRRQARGKRRQRALLKINVLKSHQ